MTANCSSVLIIFMSIGRLIEMRLILLKELLRDICLLMFVIVVIVLIIAFLGDDFSLLFEVFAFFVEFGYIIFWKKVINLIYSIVSGVLSYLFIVVEKYVVILMMKKNSYYVIGNGCGEN